MAMQAVLKIELYDAGVVLHGLDEKPLEFTGWDYTEDFAEYELAWLGVELLDHVKPMGDKVFRALEAHDHLPLFRKRLYRYVSCLALQAEELPNGSLKIRAHVHHTWTDLNATKESWHVDVTYKGNYTIFWDFNS